jgi:protein-S-isoprenylcysteine O-methyltransferase Ste14
MDWFLLSLLGFVLVIPVYFVSVEHGRLALRFGEDKGRLVGDILGYVSGWGMFVLWGCIWFSPQRGVPLGSLILDGFAVILFVVAVWLGVSGVRELGLKVSETHRPVEVVSSGVYSFVRHPQYLAGLLGHLSVSWLLSSYNSLLATPLVFAVVWVICWKEEVELVKEFSEEYSKYRSEVPMLFPRLRR